MLRASALREKDDETVNGVIGILIGELPKMSDSERGRTREVSIKSNKNVLIAGYADGVR